MSSPLPLHRRTALLKMTALAALAGLHTGCAALPPSPLLDMQLVDRDSGSVLTQYPNHDRRFSPGRPGARYAIRLSNRSRERVLVVLSVDGVNAITGGTAAWSQSGYVLNPGDSHDVTGWRKSDERIAAFEFTSLGDSYAARTGRPAHVGVVGAAVFRETPPPLREGPTVSPADKAMPAPRAAAVPSLQSRLHGEPKDASARDSSGLADAQGTARARLGTGHGASEWSPILHTAFRRRSSQPDQLLEIHYDSQANLIAAGIMPLSTASFARAFPDSGDGYVPDPPARR